jgi:hypothetical protein
VKTSLNAALLALTRDPLSLINLMLFSQASLHLVGPGFSSVILPFLLLGYFSQVLKGAILADQAQLPQAKDFKSAMGLGCMGTCFVWGFGTLAMMVALMAEVPMSKFSTPGPYLLLDLLPLWLCASVWASMIHSFYITGHDSDKGNRMLSSLAFMLIRPPISVDGLLMLALLGATGGSVYLWPGALSPAIPCAFLLSHMLGQYLRKGLGFSLE